MRSFEPVISDLTEVELFSAIARKTRTGELSAEDAGRLRAAFVGHLEAGYYERLALERRHYRVAREWLPSSSVALRTLDALHLAVAAAEDLSIATADQRQAEAGGPLGVATWLLGEEDGDLVSEG